MTRKEKLSKGNEGNTHLVHSGTSPTEVNRTQSIDKRPVQFDFRKHWDLKCKPHLQHRSVQNALNEGMLEYVDMKNDELAGMESEVRIPWYPGSCPAELCSCDGCSEKELKRGTLDWYRPHSMCHWIAPFVLALAKLIYPCDDWEIVRGTYHTVVSNKGRSVVLDILLFHEYSARESLIYAGEKPKSELEQHFFEALEDGDALLNAMNDAPLSARKNVLMRVWGQTQARLLQISNAMYTEERAWVSNG